MSILHDNGTGRFAYDNRVISIVAVLHCPTTVSKTEIIDDFLFSALPLLYKRDNFSINSSFPPRKLISILMLSHFKYDYGGVLISFVNLFLGQADSYLRRFITCSHLYIYIYIYIYIRPAILFACLRCIFYLLYTHRLHL